VLFDGSRKLEPFDFRSWRTTGCTWEAMAGTDSRVIARRAGHAKPDTTWEHYAKAGPEARRREGDPFPPLPASVVRPAGQLGHLLAQPGPKCAKSVCEGRDLNPHGVTR
jgi:hypothetical protein